MLLLKTRRILMLGAALFVLALAVCNAASPSSGRIMRGDAAAPVTIVEYTDFQCPYCANGAQTVKKIMAQYEGKVRLVVKHYPLQFHPMAMPSARYFEAIALQSPEKAWQFYDRLFADQQQLQGGEDSLKKIAGELGVDPVQLDADVNGSEVQARIGADMKAFEESRFDGVPVFVIKGTVLVGAQPAEKFIEVIEAALR
jgi:protein-disulfide isomerase